MVISATRTIARHQWATLPEPIRARAERVAGGAVTEAVSQEEGFSPGVAARCALDDGRLVFVKAVSEDLNPESVALARHEVHVNELLGATPGRPRLLGSFDDGTWVVAIFQDVAGRQPGQPWTEQDLAAVFDHLRSASDSLTDVLLAPPDAELGLEPVATLFQRDFAGWRTLQATNVPATSVEAWIDERTLSSLASIESTWTDAASPEVVSHNDVRADNLLIDAHGQVWLTDWAQAGLGPPWFDVALMVPSVAMTMPLTPSQIWNRSGVAQVDRDALTAVVVALAGYFTEAARRPPVPQIPMLRAFQEAQGAQARSWAAELLGRLER